MAARCFQFALINSQFMLINSQFTLINSQFTVVNSQFMRAYWKINPRDYGKISIIVLTLCR